MRLLTATILLLVSGAGWIYAVHLHPAIHETRAWITYLIGTVAGIGLLLFRDAVLSPRKELKSFAELNPALESFKQQAQKIIVDFDKCEFKTNEYIGQAVNPDYISLVGYADSPNLIPRTIDVAVRKTAVIYSLSETRKYISQVFPVDEKTLKLYAINQQLILFVDHEDENRYYFELQKDLNPAS